MIGYFPRESHRRKSTMSTSRSGPGPSYRSLRRGFLSKLSALGAAGALPGGLMAQEPKRAPVAARGKPYRIDVHHHLMYPGYLEEVGGRRAGSTFKWSPAMSIEDMDKSGIAASILSLIQPSASIADVEKGRRVARLSNAFGAQLARDYPGRFASFATIPLLDAEGSLKEIEYALDEIGRASCRERGVDRGLRSGIGEKSRNKYGTERE